MTSSVAEKRLDRVPGWFGAVDRQLFSWFLGTQVDQGNQGDLAELGAYLGKSAILIGAFLQQSERFTVVDLFGDAAADVANARENMQTYAALSQQAFEANYLRFHPTLPTIVRGDSSEVLSNARAGRHRFVHIDASHMYEHVAADLRSAKILLQSGGVVVLDDYRQPHTPGVAAAAWQAVCTQGLHVLAISEDKMYATWSAPDRWRRQLADWLGAGALQWEEQVVAGEPLIRVWAARSSSPVRDAIRAVTPLRVRQALHRLRRD